MDGFKKYSTEVQSLATKQPDCWEYLLTSALMTEILSPIVRKYDRLRNGTLIAKRKQLEDAERFFGWMSSKMAEAQDIAQSLSKLYSFELQKSWGSPGEPGDPILILEVCETIGQTAQLALDWETEVKFSKAEELYDGILEVLEGAVGHNLPKLMDAAKILEEGVRKALEFPNEDHSLEHTIFLDLPPNWNERVDAELEIIREALGLEQW